MIKRRFLVAAAACVVLTGGAARGATATYDYDALGRLTRVVYSDGKIAVYKYDAAGNRTQVLSGGPPGLPASITVPATSSTGSFTISWGAATGTVTAYQLMQATNASFSGEISVYSGTALSAALTGRTRGTYYYRVRACLDISCGGYRTGANGVTVP